MTRVASELRLCYKHQRVPITEINRHTQVRHKTGHAQLFDITLSFELFQFDIDMQACVATLQQLHRGTLAPLAISIHQYTYPHQKEVDQPIEIEFNFDTDYLSKAEVVTLQSRLCVLIEAALTCPYSPNANLPILPQAERQQVLVDFNPAKTDFPQATLVHELFEAQVALSPDATAVVFEGQSLSYSQLNRRANRLAHHLIALGVRPDDRVAICVEPSLDMLVGLLAILKAGGAYVPLDSATPTDRLAYMLKDAKPVALLTQTSLVETKLDTQIEILDASLPTVLLDALEPSVINTVQADHNPDPRALGLFSSHLAYVIYTSGSTGQAKGVMIEHRNASRLFAATQARFQFDASDVWTLFHSFAFDFSVWELWGALSYGGRLVIVPAACSRSPEDFYGLVCRERVTVLNQTPSAFRQLIPAQTEKNHCLRYIIFGGEALEVHTLIPWVARNSTQQTRLVNMYGITEITVHASYRELSDLDITSATGSPIGQSLSDLRIYLLDPQGRPVPIGIAGEIHIAGAGVAPWLSEPS